MQRQLNGDYFNKTLIPRSMHEAKDTWTYLNIAPMIHSTQADPTLFFFHFLRISAVI